MEPLPTSRRAWRERLGEAGCLIGCLTPVLLLAFGARLVGEALGVTAPELPTWLVWGGAGLFLYYTAWRPLADKAALGAFAIDAVEAESELRDALDGVVQDRFGLSLMDLEDEARRHHADQTERLHRQHSGKAGWRVFGEREAWGWQAARWRYSYEWMRRRAKGKKPPTVFDLVAKWGTTRVDDLPDDLPDGAGVVLQIEARFREADKRWRESKPRPVDEADRPVQAASQTQEADPTRSPEREHRPLPDSATVLAMLPDDVADALHGATFLLGEVATKDGPFGGVMAAHEQRLAETAAKLMAAEIIESDPGTYGRADEPLWDPSTGDHAFVVDECVESFTMQAGFAVFHADAVSVGLDYARERYAAYKSLAAMRALLHFQPDVDLRTVFERWFPYRHEVRTRVSESEGGLTAALLEWTWALCHIDDDGYWESAKHFPSTPPNAKRS